MTTREPRRNRRSEAESLSPPRKSRETKPPKASPTVQPGSLTTKGAVKEAAVLRETADRAEQRERASS